MTERIPKILDHQLKGLDQLSRCQVWSDVTTPDQQIAWWFIVGRVTVSRIGVWRGLTGTLGDLRPPPRAPPSWLASSSLFAGRRIAVSIKTLDTLRTRVPTDRNDHTFTLRVLTLPCVGAYADTLAGCGAEKKRLPS